MAEAHIRKKKALFFGIESEGFNAEAMSVAQSGLEVLPVYVAEAPHLLRDVRNKALVSGDWEVVIIAFSPQTASANDIQSIVSLYPDSFYYFVHPNGISDDDITRFVHGFLNHLTRRYATGTLQYFGSEITSGRVGLVFKDSESIVLIEAKSGVAAPVIPEDLSINFDPSLTPEQIRKTLTAFADYYRACGGAGLPAEFHSQEAAVLEDAHV